MQVTDVKLYKSAKEESTVKAFGKATLNDELTLDVIVMDSGKGPWASFPNGRTGKDGKFYLPVFFKDAEKQKSFNSTVVEAYYKLVGQGQPTPTVNADSLPF